MVGNSTHENIIFEHDTSTQVLKKLALLCDIPVHTQMIPKNKPERVERINPNHDTNKQMSKDTTLKSVDKTPMCDHSNKSK